MNYKDRLKRYNEDRKRRNRHESAGSASGSYQTQTNHFYPDGSYISECGPSSSPSSSSYDSGSSSSSDCGGGSSGE